MSSHPNLTPLSGHRSASAPDRKTWSKSANPTGGCDRLHFAHLPTPLEPMDRLGRHLGGPHLFIKRDDCTGLATGGNKARKLEFLMAEAVAGGADAVITQGGIQSNHARQTAAIASKLNMKCVLALESSAESQDPPYQASGNVLLDRLYGAEIHCFPPGADMEVTTQELADQYKALDQHLYIIPSGGSNPTGVLGYVNCAFEIVSQLREQGLRVDCLVHATGSGGTQAGLIVGFQLTGMKIPVLGISVSRSRPAQEQKVYDLVRQTSEHLGLKPAPPRNDVVVNSDYVGDGYGVPTDGMFHAVTTAARYESILLDPVYTGKAMDGLIDLIVNKHRFGKDKNILFLHTGGSAGLFGYTAQLNQFLERDSQND